MMLADLLHAARSAAAANAAGSGRESPSHPAVTVTLTRLSGSFMSGTVRPVCGMSGCPCSRNPDSRADTSKYFALLRTRLIHAVPEISERNGAAVAQKIQTLFVDDLDGSEADGTVRFGLDGTEYEIDLNAGHAQALRDALARYVKAARRAGAGRRRPSRGRRRTPTSGVDNTEVRE